MKNTIKILKITSVALLILVIGNGATDVVSLEKNEKILYNNIVSEEKIENNAVDTIKIVETETEEIKVETVIANSEPVEIKLAYTPIEITMVDIPSRAKRFTPEIEQIEEVNFDSTETVQNSEVATEEIEIAPSYSQEDLMLLARLINGEAGSEWIPDEHQQLVGMVVMNRVNSEYFPNTITEVIYQPGQYSCVGNSIWNEDPPQRVIDNAKLVLEGKVYCPPNVLFQAEFLQGTGIYKTFANDYSTTYFCYAD